MDLLYQDVEHRKKIVYNEDELKKVNLIYGYMSAFALSEENTRKIIEATISLMNLSYTQGYEDCKQNLKPKEIKLPASVKKPNNHTLPAPKTIRKLEKRIPEKRLNSWILLLTITLLKLLATFHLVPKKLLLVIDGHGEPYYGKYSGKRTTHVKVGQSDKWQHGKQFHGISCISPNLFLNFSYKYKTPPDKKETPFPKELTILQETIRILFSHGFQVLGVLGDRGYYDTRFFSLSKIEMWPDAQLGFAPPVMITPRQFSGQGNTKEGRKIEAALNGFIGKYTDYSMKVHHSNKKRLQYIWESLETTETGDGKMLNVYQAFHRNPMKKYTFRNDSAYSQELVYISNECIRLESTLFETKENLNHVRGCHNLDPLKGEPRKWSHKSSDLNECLKKYKLTNDLLAKSVEKRKYLLNHLFCLVFSIPDNLDINHDIPPIETLIALYSYRWRIENIFKAIKEDFHVPCSSKSSIRWLFRYLLGTMYWNYYIVCNLLKWREFCVNHHKQYRLDRDNNFWNPFSFNDSRFHPMSRMTFKLSIWKHNLIELVF
jgi:hypothetical protein